MINGKNEIPSFVVNFKENFISQKLDEGSDNNGKGEKELLYTPIRSRKGDSNSITHSGSMDINKELYNAAVVVF